MIRILFLVLVISIFTIEKSNCQEKFVYKELTENQLVNYLSNIDPEIRYYSAIEIKRRLGLNEIVIKKGNIIENTRSFWENKVSKFQKMTKIETLLDTFGITTKTIVPNYGNIKHFYLDHFFGISVELNKKRSMGKVTYLHMVPEFFNVDPPENYTGLWKIYRVDGALASEKSYKDGLLDGFWTIYSQDGSINWSKLYIKGEIYFQRSYSKFGALNSEKIYDEKEREKYKKDFEYENSFLDE